MSTPNDPKDPEILDPIDDLMLTDGEGEQNDDIVWLPCKEVGK